MVFCKQTADLTYRGSLSGFVFVNKKVLFRPNWAPASQILDGVEKPDLIALPGRGGQSLEGDFDKSKFALKSFGNSLFFCLEFQSVSRIVIIVHSTNEDWMSYVIPLEHFVQQKLWISEVCLETAEIFLCILSTDFIVCIFLYYVHYYLLYVHYYLLPTS